MSEIQFTKEHEWILMKDNIGLVGITGFAQKQLGDMAASLDPKNFTLPEIESETLKTPTLEKINDNYR